MDHSLDGWPKIALDFGCMTKKFAGCLPLYHITPQIPLFFMASGKRKSLPNLAGGTGAKKTIACRPYAKDFGLKCINGPVRRRRKENLDR